MTALGDAILSTDCRTLYGPDGAAVRVRSQVAIVLQLLERKRGAIVSRDQLAAAFYGTPGSGPKSCNNLLSVTVHEARKALRSVGSTTDVQAIWGQGYCLRLTVPHVMRRYTPEQAAVADQAIAAMSAT